MGKKTPILLLIGFLGSGKTSLLNHILQENQGLKIGVIVNDFGSINIDSLLVTRQTDSKLELSNGCICCSAEEGGLDDAISQLAHAGSTLDYIVIEASGLAEPEDLTALLERSRNKYARLDAVVAVVDAANVMDTKEKHPGFFKQLSVADIIILNKTDLVKAAKLKEIEGYLEFLNNRARIVRTKHGKADTRLLLDTGVSGQARGEQMRLGGEHDHSKHTHAAYNKVQFSCAKPLDPKAFENYMNGLLPKNVYRGKGFVYFGVKGLEQKFIFQLVGGRFSLKIDDWRGKAPTSNLVFIGEDLDDKQLDKDLSGLIDAQPDDIAGNLMDLALYR